MDDPSHSNGSPTTFSEVVRGAVRYWEPRRIIYNLILASVVLAWVVLTWPHFRPAFSLHSLLALAVLAAVANVCYCAAYIVDIIVQHFSVSGMWQRRRWGLWWVGTIFAIVLENYWIADEIYPFVD